jgi:WD40 repeat protein
MLFMIKRSLFLLPVFFALPVFSQADIVVQSGHTGGVSAIAYSHNGKYMLTGAGDNSIVLWDFKSGMQVRRYAGHSKGITGVCFTSDDKLLVSCSHDQTLKIWDTYTGNCVRTVEGYAYGLTQVQFSKTSGFMAATCRDRTFSLWDFRSGTPVYHDFKSNSNYGDMADVCFDTSETVYFAAWDGTIYYKDLTKDINFNRFDTIRIPGGYGHINALEVTGDGKYIMVGCDGSGENMGDFLIIEKSTRRIVYRKQNYVQFMGDYANAISVSADNNYVAYCTASDQGIQVLDLRTFKTDHTIPLKECTVIKFSFGSSFLSCAEGTVVTEYNINKGIALHEYKGFTSPVNAIQVNTDGRITSYHPGSLQVWDLNSGKAEPFAENISAATNQPVAVSYDRSKVAYEKNHKVYIYDTEKRANTNVLSNFEYDSKTFLFSNSGTYFGLVNDREFLYTTKGYERKIMTDKVEDYFYTSLYFSPDDSLFITRNFGSDAFNVWDIASKEKRVVSYEANDIGPFAVSQRYIAAIVKDRLNATQSAFLTDVQNSYENKTDRKVEDKDFLVSSASLDRPKYIVVWDRRSLKVVKALKLPKNDKDAYTETPQITAITFDSTGNYIAMGSTDNLIRIWSMETGKIVKQMEGHHAQITSIAFAAGDKYMVSSSEDGSIIVWDGNTYEQLATMILIGTEDYIIVTPENYYTCSKNGIKALAFRKDNLMYPFSQFDLKYNRPDKVLERLKSANLELILALRKAYEKRLKKAGVKEENLNDELRTPEVSIEDIYSIPLNSLKPTTSFTVIARDDKVKIKSINVSVNDVPQCYTYSFDAKADDANYVEKIVNLKLMNGRNKIVVTCMNREGVESLPVELEMNYAEKDIGNVYFIGIAVAGYKNPEYNLKYTVKDIRDLASAFKQKYPKLIVDTLLDSTATRSNILKLKQKLNSTNVNDIVVMAISGHGLLSRQLDFYFATYDIDFKDPTMRGIKYEDIEALYDCIAARKKLLLLDACHSGEVDKDGNMRVKDVLPEGVKETRTKGSQLLVSDDNISLSNSFELMQDIFANLSKGNGSVVISAAGGQEYALESAQWNNGVFTYCVLQALLYNKADANNNKETTIGELKKYVSAEVVKLTGGRQKPTSRRENLLFDWRVW